MKLYELFIDELGQSNPASSQSDVYILCGCVVEQALKDRLRIEADHIKFKYWGRTDIVFHSREIGRNEGYFNIFKRNQSKKSDFLNDLFRFLKHANISIFAVICNNALAKQRGWNAIKVVKETGKLTFFHFISWLFGVTGAQGKITIESATAEKDKYYLHAFSYFLSPGCKEISVSYKKVQAILTSISFVTKHNQDIEEQIADLFAYAIQCRYLRSAKKQRFPLGSYEDRIIRVLEKKLFQMPRSGREKKMKFYRGIESFCVVPKT